MCKRLRSTWTCASLVLSPFNHKRHKKSYPSFWSSPLFIWMTVTVLTSVTDGCHALFCDWTVVTLLCFVSGRLSFSFSALWLDGWHSPVLHDWPVVTVQCSLIRRWSSPWALCSHTLWLCGQWVDVCWGPVLRWNTSRSIGTEACSALLCVEEDVVQTPDDRLWQSHTSHNESKS